ncbi:TetR/AcrR family transcriptional regulator [Nocardia sp. NPDC050712]|uniref:TetR/AcrR family transcriptional regulator n=1 Tax=Nocardia sp. NPDC050712 TaxID=3155518 RepID=UPI0033F82B0F
MPKAADRRRSPTQRRAKATREHILDTAARLFGERGVSGTSTNRIAAEAQVSIGTLYRYFTDRAVIVEELLTRLLEGIEQRVTELADDTDDMSIRERYSTIVDVIFEEMAANAGLVRALVGGVHFYNTAIPQFEPRLHLSTRAVLVKVLGPGATREFDYDTMTFVIINTIFAAVVRASATEIDEDFRAETVEMTGRMIGTWIESEAGQAAGAS